MRSVILSTATRYVLPLLLLFSIFLLLRGHSEPGGGFVGGLVAATAFIFYTLAFNVHEARKTLRVDPKFLIGFGLLTAVSSAMLSLFSGEAFMTGLWGTYAIPGIGKIGTPVIFDVGVYMVVLGVVLTIILTLAEGD